MKEIFYRSNEDKLMSVAIQTEPTLTVGPPKELFDLRRYAPGLEVRNYDVASDGEHFLLLKPVVPYDEFEPQIVVVENWFEGIETDRSNGLDAIALRPEVAESTRRDLSRERLLTAE